MLGWHPGSQQLRVQPAAPTRNSWQSHVPVVVRRAPPVTAPISVTPLIYPPLDEPFGSTSPSGVCAASVPPVPDAHSAFLPPFSWLRTPDEPDASPRRSSASAWPSTLEPVRACWRDSPCRRAPRRCCASCTPRPCRGLPERGQSASTTGPGVTGAPGVRSPSTSTIIVPSIFCPIATRRPPRLGCGRIPI